MGQQQRRWRVAKLIIKWCDLIIWIRGGATKYSKYSRRRNITSEIMSAIEVIQDRDSFFLNPRAPLCRFINSMIVSGPGAGRLSSRELACRTSPASSVQVSLTMHIWGTDCEWRYRAAPNPRHPVEDRSRQRRTWRSLVAKRHRHNNISFAVKWHSHFKTVIYENLIKYQFNEKHFNWRFFTRHWTIDGTGHRLI